MPPSPRPAAVTSPAWFAAALALALFDAAATARVVRGPDGEANPLLGRLMAAVGVGPALVLRVLVAVVLLSALLGLAERSRAAVTGLVVATAAHAGVALWHLAGPTLAG